jgi:hypothetical protein
MAKILLTHIPKTAGSSIREAVFTPFIEEGRKRLQGGWDLLTMDTDFSFLRGHYPYGIHWPRPSLWGDTRYFVMLRHPVERAISHYYFIRNTSHENFKHPSLPDAEAHSLVDFYRLPRYQNMQVRYVSGLHYYHLKRLIHLRGPLKGRALRAAKNHLDSGYEAFGLAERFKDSARLFAAQLGVEATIPDRRHKKTPDRPSRDNLDSNTLRALRDLNAVDVELYDYAVSKFEAQFEE